MRTILQSGLPILLTTMSCGLGYAQPAFTEVNAGFVGEGLSSVAWGDYDNDGYLDVAIMGRYPPRTTIYHNDRDGTFTGISPGLAGLAAGGLAWGDYDNDGYLDLAVSGYSSGTFQARIYHNDRSGRFSDIGANLVGADVGTVAWGDYDNDGYLDLLIVGSDDGAHALTVLYHNRGDGSFTNSGVNLPPVCLGSAAWGDYDNDGWVDLALAGATNTGGGPVIGGIYRNNRNGTFTDIRAGLPAAYYASLAWGDHDNDGRMDLLLAGAGPPLIVRPFAQVYQNAGAFTGVSTNLPGIFDCSVVWGDFDNDGRLDLALSGARDPSETNLITRIYRNDGSGNFTDIGAGMVGLRAGSIACADYDNDGALDLLVTGIPLSGPDISRLYHNESTVKNTPPTAPPGLNAAVNGAQMTLNWEAATDAQTPAPGLTYNVRVGTTPGGCDVVSPQSAPNGFRRVPQMGNAGPCLFKYVMNLKAGNYYWSVQSVDTAYAGSPFASEQRFTVPPAFRSIAVQPGDLIQLEFVGLPVTKYSLQSSTNLLSWTGVTNFTTRADGLFIYTAPQVRGSPAEFFQAVGGADLVRPAVVPDGSTGMRTPLGDSSGSSSVSHTR
jgi:hypothetical protein